MSVMMAPPMYAMPSRLPVMASTIPADAIGGRALTLRGPRAAAGAAAAARSARATRTARS